MVLLKIVIKQIAYASDFFKKIIGSWEKGEKTKVEQRKRVGVCVCVCVCMLVDWFNIGLFIT